MKKVGEIKLAVTNFSNSTDTSTLEISKLMLYIFKYI